VRKINQLLFLIQLLIFSYFFFVSALIADDGNISLDWPQWLGPNRDGISLETGLIKSWPKEGPEVLWRTQIGEGYSGISGAQGRIYTMDSRQDDEFVVCMDASDGEEIWRARTDEKYKNGEGNGPRSTPTVDGDQVFSLSARGKLQALRADSGEKLWEHDLVPEFGSNIPGWGFSTSPLIEDNLLLVEVGGNDTNSIVAFEKETGDVAWSSHTDQPSYSSPISITFRSVRQIIFLTAKTLVSVSPLDGQIFWKYSWEGGINIATPIFIPEDKIFISTSYDKGSVLLQMIPEGDQFLIKEVWKSRVMKNHFNSSVLNNGHLYGFDNAILKCIEADTGEEKWKHRGLGKGSLIYVDGHLIVLGEEGRLVLVEANSTKYIEKAGTQILRGRCWTSPTLAAGKLYLRDQNEMVCLDVLQRI